MRQRVAKKSIVQRSLRPLKWDADVFEKSLPLSSDLSCMLHLGCFRQSPILDITELIKDDRKRHSTNATTNKLPAGLDPMVMKALASISTSPTASSHSQPHRLWLGVDSYTNSPHPYPGVTVMTDMHQVQQARHHILLSAGFGYQASLTTPLFDGMISDVLSPLLHKQAEPGPLSSMYKDDASKQVNALQMVKKGTTTAIAPRQMRQEDDYVTDPVLASLAVGLPMLRADGTAAIRVSWQSEDRSSREECKDLKAAVRTLRHKFANVELRRDDCGMILFAYGSSSPESATSLPHNLREDFPGFQRGTRRAKRWSHYHDPLDANQRFFKALHPAFDKAPPPEQLMARLQEKKLKDEEKDKQYEAYQELVSQTLDTFNE